MTFASAQQEKQMYQWKKIKKKLYKLMQYDIISRQKQAILKLYVYHGKRQQPPMTHEELN